MFRPKTLLGLGLALSLALTIGAGTASASIQLSLAEKPGFPGPYGTVTVTLDSVDHSVAHVEFDANTAGGYHFFDTGMVALSINDTGTFTVSNITSTPSHSISQDAAGNEDGFGTFNLRLTEGPPTTQIDVVKFDVTKSSGTWTSDANVLIDNGNGHLAAAHIFADFTVGGVNTFFATDGPTPAVPEPSTMLIAAVGALGFLGYGLRRRRKG